MTTKTSAALSLNDAIVARVEADVDINLVLAPPGIYSGRVPREKGFPRITLGSSEELTNAAFGRSGSRGIETLHVWSDKPGKREVLSIHGHIYRLFHGQPLTMNGHTSRLVRVRLVTCILDPDGKTMHGVTEIDASSAVG